MTFLCGRGGVYAVGAVVANYRGDHQRRDLFLSLFLEVILISGALSPDLFPSPFHFADALKNLFLPTAPVFMSWPLRKSSVSWKDICFGPFCCIIFSTATCS